MAAAEARLAASSARDVKLRETLLAIAADEPRHAELAFAFVHWAVANDSELARAALEAARAELASAKPNVSAGEDAWLLPHGIVPVASSANLRRQALRRTDSDQVEVMMDLFRSMWLP